MLSVNLWVRDVLMATRPRVRRPSRTHGTRDQHRFAMDNRCRHIAGMPRAIVTVMTGPIVGVMIMTITNADPDPQRNIRPGCCKPCAQHERAQG